MGKFRKSFGFECKFNQFFNILAKYFSQNFHTKTSEKMKKKWMAFICIKIIILNKKIILCL